MPIRTRRASAKTQTVQRDEDKFATPRRAKGKRGGLERMPDMPLDILIEIMGHLMPLDLLHLARASKGFRSFLMARSASPLWKAARQNVVGFPECPEDLSEPAYANLVFDMHCHGCLQPGTKTIMWALRVRFCPSCRSEESNLLKWCPNHRASVFTESCDDLVLPYTRATRGKGHWHLASALRDMTEIFDTLTAEELDKVVRKNKAIMQHAKRCELWHARATASRNQERDALRDRRLQAVIVQLKELGWSATLTTMTPDYDQLRECREVRQAKELTDREWIKIKSTVEAHMYEVQSKQEATA